MTLGQGIELGVFSFSVIRILIAAGVVRVIVRRDRVSGGINGLDWLMLVWAGWALVSSIFHKDPLAALVLRLGLVYNTCGIYFLIRVFCRSLDDGVRLCRATAILLLPLAVIMLFEKVTAYNLFSMLGGVSEHSVVRDGSIRAQGPFSHPILAGTVGAACLPLMIGLWQQHRKSAITGIAACILIILTSASGGPIVTAMAAITALFLWRYRQKMRFVRWFAVLCYIALDIVMNAPAYYLMARYKVIGASTAWYRARLIESAFQHLDEWWLAGTDFTRHWMPVSVSWSADHTDITNHYIKMGVIGGIPLMMFLIMIFIMGFSYVGQIFRKADELPDVSKFILWSFGASLFAHVVTSISVSYFDQSFLFIYLTLAAIGSAYSSIIPKQARDITATI